MEPISLEDLELELVQTTDPVERRRIRSRIRRLKIRSGISTARVSSRTQNPYEDESPQDSKNRLKKELRELGLKSYKNWTPEVSVHAFKMDTSSEVLVKKFKYRWHRDPEWYSFHPTVALVLLGPIT